MSSKIWNFLLPGDGKHQLRADNLGSPSQTIFIDGVPQDNHQVLVFVGPDSCLMELRHTGQSWSLSINGLLVEEYTSEKRKNGDESMRQLRSMPDGSYMIATEFDMSTLQLNIVRKFKYLACGQVHEVQIAHYECIWQVLNDGVLVDRVAHKLSENFGVAKFDIVSAFPGVNLTGHVCMEWVSKSHIWKYTLDVNGIDVPANWNKQKGDISYGVQMPVVIGDDPTMYMDPSLPSEEDSSSVPQYEEVPPPAEFLPQGVSFDPSTSGYQANIRGKTGKFVFLGEFTTPEEAHMRYLEAVPIHCPNRLIAPDCPGQG